jgi:hypothetical protein
LGGVTANRQIDFWSRSKGLLRARTCISGRCRRRQDQLSGRRDAIVYYKNNAGLAMQFAACGASCIAG